MIQQVVVIGAGTMGRGLARLLIGKGIEVILTDVDDRVLVAARMAVGDSGDLLRVAPDWRSAASDPDLVIECASEARDVKEAVLNELSATLPHDVVIASNTSSFTPGDLAQYVVAPERFLCLHFFNPPDTIRLVEIQGHAATSPGLVESCEKWIRGLSGSPVVVGKQVPGFVANRLQAALLSEAIALVQDGVVSASDLDAVVVHGLGPRWAAVGPLTVVDLGGLDVFAALMGRICPTLAPSTVAVQALADMVGAGLLGEKAETGFYNYPRSGTNPRQRIASTTAALQSLSAIP